MVGGVILGGHSYGFNNESQSKEVIQTFSVLIVSWAKAPFSVVTSINSA